MNPIVHTENAMKKFGGTTSSDFDKLLAIHKKMDCSKAYFSDNRHRALTHTMFWVQEVMLPIFGDYIEMSSGKKVSVKDICEQHILEDFRMKFIPTVQDFLQEMEMKTWMQNGKGIPNSSKRLYPELVEKPKFNKPTSFEGIDEDELENIFQPIPTPKVEEITPNKPIEIPKYPSPGIYRDDILDGIGRRGERGMGGGMVLD